MNQRQLQYFEALFNDRTQSANILDKSSMRGVKHSVVEKYSDQAHFVYELLQNANDARATYARFILEKNRLIFAHNGSRQFSVSDPANEEEDSANGRLGDINAITSIGNSNKTEASIGKFGVGFKAVFQYTSAPCIYDPVFHFQIERFIVPRLLESDFEGRLPNETLFVFPFDNPCKAYSDILEKLKNLIYPVLFLDNLERVTVTCQDFYTEYSRDVLEQMRQGATLAQKIQLKQPTGVEQLWLFTREMADSQYKLSYSVGYFLNDKGNLRPVNLPAFCFFPTRESTGLNFIIHAPFLLTDSREGIRAGDEYNENMIKCLSKLAGDSMIYLRDIGANLSPRLIDDNILAIIPTDEKKFPKNPSHHISFYSFYENIMKIFQTAEILPTAKGYTKKENAYWATFPSLPNLFSDSQLAEICNNPNAQWVFRNIGRDQINHDQILRAFISSLVRTFISDEVILKGRKDDFYWHREPIPGITNHFIEKQSISWLHLFYAWINENSSRIKLVRSKPIFIDSNNHAAAAFNDNDYPTLFLPAKDISGYRIINEELLNNDTTKGLIHAIGIKEPDFMAYFINVFIPKYFSNNSPCEKDCFLALLTYWKKASNIEKTDIMKAIKERKFLKYKVGDQVASAAEKPGILYMPTELLCNYFENNSSIKFLALEHYQQMVGVENHEILDAFFKELGIHYEAKIVTKKISEVDAYSHKLPRPQGRTTWIRWEEKSIEGLDFAIQNIAKSRSLRQSLAVWKSLLFYVENGYNLNDLFSGNCVYYYYRQYEEKYLSHTAELLKSETWLIDSIGKLCNASSIYRESLSNQYDKLSLASQKLFDFLGIKDEVEDIHLTDEQRAKIEFADRLNSLGISEADIETLKEIKQQREAKLQDTNKDEACLANEAYRGEATLPSLKKEKETTKSRVVKEIVNRTESIKDKRLAEKQQQTNLSVQIVDQDEYMPSTINFAKQIDRAKQKSAEEIEKITQLEELHARAINAGKYTYEWFSSLLEIESFDSGDDALSSREVSISFARAEREPGTKRTLVLKHPNRYIPHFMEELADIPIILHFGTQTKTVIMEVSNIVSYSLRVKLRRDSDIEDIDFSTLTEATIDAKSPAFLLLELKKGFEALNYSPEYNMQQNLTSNIEFIFGPPGTGKTTYLARKVLMPLMAQSSRCRVLVLTPTNKAADVLTARIMESCSNKDYENWLVRFGATADEKIEQSPVYRDKTFDIRNLARSVTITTIARFPYDSFMPQGERLHLCALNWDYIVIDEASMIPLASIVYPLYKKQPKKFIIAGDPFQIEPITTVDLWKNENIYTMVGLDSFSNPRTTPHNYRVELLTTQYRSIPEIGKVFSQFAYDGILKHHRSSYSRRTTGFDDIAPLNIIKFPVSRYESIYRSKRLKHSSSYQIYSALFTFEYVCHLARKIKSKGEPFKIGVIAPYRAQADLIDKLLSSEVLPTHIEVYVGTIHGFQGDECDMIFAVFNTPPSISASNEMFLNKRNIINVSISRARDYLYIVMPDDETEGIENLRLIRKVEQIIKRSESWSEFHSPNLEEEMFNDKRWLENNSFSTSHQSVNVYGLPEKRYEVRSEDAAVDIQIHRAVERPKLATEEKTYNRTTNDISTPRVSGSLLGAEILAQPSNSLTLRQQQALSVLKRLMQTEPTGVTLKTLAQHIQVSPPGTSLIVNALEEMGLLERVNNPNDRRSIFLKLTDKGLALIG